MTTSLDKNVWGMAGVHIGDGTGDPESGPTGSSGVGMESTPPAGGDGIGKAVKLPGAASLYEQLDKLVLVCLRDGRTFYGWLRSFDQYANLTLDNTVERLAIDNLYADVPIGIFIIRGENVMLLGQVDEHKEMAVSSTMQAVSESELRRLLAARESDTEGTQWAVPEEI